MSWIEALLARAERRSTLFVAAVATLLYLPWLEAGPIPGSIEACRLVASREMLDSGNWVVPTLNGKLYLAKPPFQYWLVALLSLPLGEVSLWSARMISGLSVVGLSALTAHWVAREASPRAGLRAGLFVALSGVLLEKGVLAELEMVLALATALAVFLLWSAVWSETRGRLAVVGAGLALGAAITTKGPVPLLPFGAAAVALIATAVERRRRAAASSAATLVIALLVPVPWILSLEHQVGREAVLEVFGFEVFNRLHSPGGTNREPFWYYVTGVVSALAPVSLLLPAVIFAVRRDPTQTPRRRALALVLLAWSLGTAILLSFSKGKEVRYLIATVPAWCMLVALGMEWPAGWWRAYVRGLKRAAAFFWYALLLIALVAGWATDALVAGAVSAAAVGASIAVARTAGGGSTVGVLLPLALGLLGVKVAWAKVYLAHRTTTNPVVAMGRSVGTLVPEGTPLYVLGEYPTAIHFAVDRPIVVLDEADAAAFPESAYLLTREERSPAQAAGGDWQLVQTWNLRSRPFQLLRLAPRGG